MSNTGGKSNKVTIFVLNILFFIMGLIVVISYTTESFFSAQMNVNLTKEQIIGMVDEEQYPDLNLESVLPESGLQIENVVVDIPADTIFSVSIELMRGLVKGTAYDSTETINEIFSKPFDTLVDGLHSTLRDIAIQVAKSIAAKEARNSLIAAVQLGGTEKTPEEIESILADAGYDINYFNQELDIVVEKFNQPNATVTVVQMTDEAVAMLNDLIDTIHSDENLPEDIRRVQSDDIDTDTLKESITSGLGVYANAEGIIDIDNAIADLLLEVFGLKDETTQSGDLKSTVKEKFISALPKKPIDSFLKISAFLLILSVSVWSYLLLKIICKTFMQDNSVKFGLPIFLGCLPGFLAIIPSIALSLIKKDIFVEALGAQAVTLLTEVLSISFSASGLMAILGAIVLIIFAIPYCIARHSQRSKNLKVKKFR